MSGTPQSHQTVRLARGWHATPDDGVCVVELASMLASEPFSDRPSSVCRLIASLLRAYNDIAGDRRQELYECAAMVVGTRGSRTLERRRIDHALKVLDELEDAGRTGALRRFRPFSTMAGRLRGLVAIDPVPAIAIDQFGGGLARLLRRRGDDGHDRVLRLVAELAAMRDEPAPAVSSDAAADLHLPGVVADEQRVLA
jgi:hypothetical protein